ncbi:putative lipid II flippase FtsW [Kocuria tytonis]|uniref:Probable peptidoglycan glycosyltransferase FtsW n=1 Tax=Kocuria tytonis TaxID=2054280 RepID=A0A495A897_9MICC|nr:putative lipid II flippase FtsW [Kocuria tytonis]RKQ36167.1 putative lipid II flippase FtsW [Kocuria tytonis]
MATRTTDRPAATTVGETTARGAALSTRARRLWHQVTDGPLFHSYYALAGCVVLLTGIGVMMVLSASAVESISDSRSAYALFGRQAVFALLGLLAMFGLSLVPTHVFRRAAWPLWLLSVLLSLLVFTPLGREVNGNRNWLVLGGQSVQPSELAKLALSLWLAALFTRQGAEVEHEWKKALWPSLAGFIVPTGMVLAGGDAGTAIVFCLIYAAALWFARAPLRIFVGGGALLVAAGLFLVVTAPHRLDRITGWLFGECGATDACWQAQQGLNALATGGWWGVGLGQSRLKYNYVPEAHNDYIFSIIGEELGLVGTTIILALFIVMVVAMARILTRTRSTFVRITTACITTWLVGQAFVNLGMVTGLLPVIGIPLPFISYGGSALLMTMAAVGVVMSFARVPRTVRVRAGDQILDTQEARERGLDTASEHDRPSWRRLVSSRLGKGNR